QTLDMVIPHGAVANAEFPAFIPMDPNELYRIVVTTNLEGDQDTTNDTMIKYFNTYATDRQKVMVEIGTGTWCQYCPGAALGADDLVSNGKQVAVVEYHNGDTFTNDASNARNTYYSVPGFPTAYFDGTTKFVGGNHTTSTYQWYLPIYEAAFPIMSPFYISMTGSLEGTTLTTNVDVKRFARISDSPLVLHFAVTESNIAFSWQGQSELDFVERAMTPDYNGTTLAIQDVESQSIELTTTLNTAWNQPELELVAFIQDPATKVIYQGFVISLPDLLPQYQASAPISLQATQDGAVVHLAWTQPTDNAGLSGYLIYRDGVLIHTITHPTSSTYDDVAVDGNRSYYVKALYGPAISGQSNTFTLEVSASDPVATPVLSSLTGNYPNPFLSSTSIRYEMKNDAKVSLAIYNIKGQLVRVLENGMKTTGSHNVVWDGTDKNGNKLASGVYIVQFNTGNVKQSQKVIMMK
ncbi:MAG TPA: FlgD immunoglobulin-like domain containing protein, partial [Candidatus Cloacimonadota bacterium]|nr:FlgD immunoglobulin-like domain containing protein [Candidatus Cloacimonadota bacterium]